MSACHGIGLYFWVWQYIWRFNVLFKTHAAD